MRFLAWLAETTKVSDKPDSCIKNMHILYFIFVALEGNTQQ